VNLTNQTVDRRSFLRGSALFAAALGLGVAAPSFAQEQQQKPPEKKPEEKPEQKPTPADPFAEEEKYGKGESETKVDKDGREYRTCPQCASNMYKQGRTWTCENCGYSYVE
jgi:ribosomal protein S27AE